MKSALITGITGMDGSHIADMLLEKGYTINGLARRTATPNNWRIAHIEDKINVIDGDMTDFGSLILALDEAQPDIIFNMAAQSFVPTSFKNKRMTMETNAIGVANLLDAIKKVCPNARMIQASTSEIFGKVLESPQTEKTPPYPRSPYGISKLAAFWLTVNAREADDLHCSNSICFNHEGPRRGKEFVTRKISLGVARIAAGEQDVLTLGNLDALRDWGYAPDYCRAMLMMLEQDKPDDYVVATGKMHSVGDFCSKAFAAVGMFDWEKYVKTDPLYYRPAEVQQLCGDASKARDMLHWEPEVSFEDLVTLMVREDVKRVESGNVLG